MYNILLLSEQDIKKCIDSKKAIQLVEDVFRKIGNNQVSEDRSKLLDVGEGFICYSAGYAEGTQTNALIETLYFDNPLKYKLKSGFGLSLLFDSKTGVPLSVMSCYDYIEAITTSCASAVTAKYLAKRDSNRLAIIGAGHQAASHFMAMRELFNWEEVRVVSRTSETRERFVENMGKYGIKILPTNSVEEAVKESDIVILVTTADAPLIKKDWIERGMLILKVGSYQEMEPEILLTADKVVVDSWDYIKKRSKEIGLLLKQGLISEGELEEKKFLYAELPEIVAGRNRGRENDSEAIVSIQLGLCADYAAIATHVYHCAVATGLGKRFNLISGETV